MARKLGIVMGNGRRSTPLTERKLEPEERSWEDTAILRERSLREPVPQREPPVEGGAQRRKRTGISKEREFARKGTKGKAGGAMWNPPLGGRDRRSFTLDPAPPFLYLSFPFFSFLCSVNCARKLFAGLN